MKYSEVRPQIKSGDLLCWSHRGWFSIYDLKIQAVRIFTRSEWSHVGTAWVVGDRVFVIEAVMPLVRIYPLSKLGEFGWLPLNAKWSPEALEYALSKVGQKYSQLQAMQSPFLKPPEDGLWQCSELAALVALRDGIDLGTTFTPSAVVREAQLRGAPLSIITPDPKV